MSAIMKFGSGESSSSSSKSCTSNMVRTLGKPPTRLQVLLTLKCWTAQSAWPPYTFRSKSGPQKKVPLFESIPSKSTTMIPKPSIWCSPALERRQTGTVSRGVVRRSRRSRCPIQGYPRLCRSSDDWDSLTGRTEGSTVLQCKWTAKGILT